MKWDVYFNRFRVICKNCSTINIILKAMNNLIKVCVIWFLNQLQFQITMKIRSSLACQRDHILHSIYNYMFHTFGTFIDHSPSHYSYIVSRTIQIKRSKSHIPLCQTYKLQILINHEITKFWRCYCCQHAITPSFRTGQWSF